MYEDNRKFLSADSFGDRIKNIMECKNISLDELHNIMNDQVGYQITKSNLSIYLKRIPNVNFLIALSRSLGVSTDCLLGMDDKELCNDGFDYDYGSQKYKKYIGDYYFHFYPTVNNSPSKVVTAVMKIEQDVKYRVSLTIQTDEEDIKEYVGNLILSNTYNTGYIILRCKSFGEMVSLSFCDPVINGTKVKVEFLIGSMMSVSSGDFKRVPVMSRFILSREKITPAIDNVIKANLLLNTKYINISTDSVKDAVAITDFDDDLKNRISERLQSAFSERKYLAIEESFILNTLKADFRLTFSQSVDLLAQLRLHSLSNANSKLNNALDARYFAYMKENNQSEGN